MGMEELPIPKGGASQKGFTSFPAQPTQETRYCFPQVPLRTTLLSQEIYNASLSKIHHFTKTPMDAIFFNFPIVVVEMIILLFSLPIFRVFQQIAIFHILFIRPWLPQDEGHQPWSSGFFVIFPLLMSNFANISTLEKW